MKVPYKVYVKNKLVDLHYDSKSATLKSIKEKLIEKGFPKTLVVKQFNWR